MEIACLSCGSLFSFDNRNVKSTESLVRCSKCHFIFLIHRPSFAEEPIAEDTNIDQSILVDLYSTKHEFKTESPINQSPLESDDYVVHSLVSIDEFEEEAGEELAVDFEDLNHINLPDLTEYENMIDWGEDSK